MKREEMSLGLNALWRKREKLLPAPPFVAKQPDYSRPGYTREGGVYPDQERGMWRTLSRGEAVFTHAIDSRKLVKISLRFTQESK